MGKEQRAKRSRRRTTEERRRLIVEVAAACFAEKGFHQTSIRDIAHKAGISLGNLYNHFDSKGALVAEIAGLEADELHAVAAALRRPGTPPEALQHFAKAYLDFAAQPVNVLLAAEITAEAMRDPAIAAKFDANREHLVESIKTVLAEGAADGYFDDTLAAAETARLILDLLDGVAMRTAFSTKRVAALSRKAALAMVAKALSA